MKFSLDRIILLTICLVTTTSIATPVYYDINEDVEVRAEPIIETRDGATAVADTAGAVAGAAGAVSGVAGAVSGIMDMISKVVGGIKAGIEKDKELRGDFTSKLVGDMSHNNPAFNYVVCHTKHTTAFDGVEGTDWGHSHQEFDVKVGGTIGYEIYYLKSGVFTRQGDGGFLNWAYIGNVKSTSTDGKVITFAAP